MAVSSIQRLAVPFVAVVVVAMFGCERSAVPTANTTIAPASGGNGVETDSSAAVSQERVPPGTVMAAGDFAELLAKRGGNHVVVQVFAEACGPCMTEAIELNDRLDAWRARGIAVVGLGMDDSPESVQAFYQQTGRRIRFPLYCAPWFAEQQEVTLTPTLFIYDTAGKQLFRADAESQQEGLLEALEAKLNSVARHSVP